MKVILQIKYSSSTYLYLCFRHAVQEAMRGEDIETEIVDSGYLETMTDSCHLCEMSEEEREEAIMNWYMHYKENK